MAKEIAQCEARVEKLEDMLAQIDSKLTAPELYEADGLARLEKLQVKRGEVVDGLARAEELWLKAQAELEEAS